ILLSFQSLWDSSLSALLGAMLLWGTMRVSECRRGSSWAAYGLLWGIALMTNAALLSLAAFQFGWLLYRLLAPGWRWFARPALAIAITTLACVPWTIRNYAIFHSFIPLRSVLGLQLWVGNNPSAKVIWLGERHPINDTAERERYTSLGEVAYMSE